MRKILIVGAGQAGLQLGLSLLANGYEVTMMSARTPDEIRGGRVTSTQVLFDPALRVERRHGLNLWEEETPKTPGIHVSLIDPPGNIALSFVGELDGYCQSVDQRVKMAGWLELFENRGGKVIYHSVMTSDLEGLTKLYDLTLIAAGKGELVDLFHRDPERSPYDSPMRALSVIYLHGVTPRAERPEPNIGISLVPGVGELFSIPAYSTSGPCHIEFIEGIPGGPFDCWDGRPAPKDHLERLLPLLREYFPYEYDRCVNAEPIDDRCCVTGRYPPMVRNPVGKLSETAMVLGMGDVVVVNDPIAGQGANNAVHCAEAYLQSILDRGDQPFDGEWMQATFDKYWDYAQHSTNWSNALLQPPPPHVQQVLGAASQNQTVADRFGNGFATPADYAEWILAGPDKTEAYLAEVAGDSAS